MTSSITRTKPVGLVRQMALDKFQEWSLGDMMDIIRFLMFHFVIIMIICILGSAYPSVCEKVYGNIIMAIFCTRDIEDPLRGRRESNNVWRLLENTKSLPDVAIYFCVRKGTPNHEGVETLKHSSHL